MNTKLIEFVLTMDKGGDIFELRVLGGELTICGPLDIDRPPMIYKEAMDIDDLSDRLGPRLYDLLDGLLTFKG